MDTIRWVRRFFEEQLAGLEYDIRHLWPGARISTQHLVAHLVEKTIRRAVLDAASYDGRETGDVSWEDCLMVAALTELRSIKLVARQL